MNIIFTLKFNKINLDLKVDENQRIYDTLLVLKENGLNIPNSNQIKSKNNKKYISVFSTYKQEKIYTGDILKFKRSYE